MPFNLRGGRPKNMGQGIYWVQRHQADQRREASLARRNATALEKAEKFNERYSRIVKNCADYHRRHQEESIALTPKQSIDIAAKMENYNLKKKWIDNNIDEAGFSDLTKLSTLARSVIVWCAKKRCQKISYQKDSKVLEVDGIFMDFS